MRKYLLTLVDISRYTWRRMGKSYTATWESELDAAEAAMEYESRFNDAGCSVVRRVIDVREVQ